MNRPTILASIVICAYTEKRWDLLVAAVESACAQSGDPEVIVVIDHEESLLARARARWPHLAVVPNASRAGLSGARNTGIAAARGEIVAFLDDDAAASPHWLTTLSRHFVDPSLVAVGGGALPAWDAETRVGFLPPELYWIVGCSHAGLPTVVSEVRNVIGCSMAFRRSTLLASGGFALDIGRVGSLPLGCEETELCIRIRQADPSVRIIVDPGATVVHRVSAERLTWGYLRRRSYGEGLSKALLADRLGVSDALATEFDYTQRVLPRAFARELRARRPARAATIAVALLGAAAGYARGSIRPIPPLSESGIPRIPDLSGVL